MCQMKLVQANSSDIDIKESDDGDKDEAVPEKETAAKRTLQ